jgi:hypothetical protein
VSEKQLVLLQAADVARADDFFRCRPYGANLLADACIKRQRAAAKADAMNVRVEFTKCLNCHDGQALRERVEGRVPYRSAVRQKDALRVAEIAARTAQAWTVGETIPDAWFDDFMGIGVTDEHVGRQALAEQNNRNRLRGEFVRQMLVHHGICLRVVEGEGWSIVPPAEQASFAGGEGQSELRAIFKQWSDRLTHVNESALSGQDRAALNNERARVGKLRQFVLPPDARPADDS